MNIYFIIKMIILDFILTKSWVIYTYFGPLNSWLILFPFHSTHLFLRHYAAQLLYPEGVVFYIFIYSCSLYFVALGPSRARALLQLQTCLKTMPSKTCHAIAPLSQCCHLFSVCYYCEVHMEKAAKKSERERGEERALKARKRNANAISWAQSFFTRAAQFRFQSQMQTNRCLCFCTCNDNKAQLSARELRKLLRFALSTARALNSSLSQSLSVDCPSFPPPTVKTRSLIAHLSSCQQSEPHWVVTTQITSVWHQLHMLRTCSKAISFFIF